MTNEWRYDPAPRDYEGEPRRCADCCFFDEAPHGGDGICAVWHITESSPRYIWVTAAEYAEDCQKFEGV